MSKSIVYLVGAGPGDYKLISLRGAELIEKADCIVYDYLANPKLLSFANPTCKLIYVGKKASKHTLTQEKINNLLLKQAKRHKLVVRLKGGDPLVFGRGAEEALYLRKNKINFEIVPGISSAIAVPAYAGIPVTHRTKNSTVGFVTGHEDPTKLKSNIDWSALAKALGTIVFLMGLGNLKKITKKLIECGKSKTTPVAIIRWGTTPNQKTVLGTLNSIVNIAKKSKITPPAIIVVGEVASLRKQLNWFEKKPLFGKRVLITRTRAQASRLCEKIADLGGQAIEIPAIEIVSKKADKKLMQAFKIKDFDWIFFTSQNGVKEFSEILKRYNKDVRLIAKSKVCAIGSETAKSLEKIGIIADYIPRQFVAESILKDFSKKNLKGKSALILRAKKARDVLPDGLKGIGLQVETIDLYDTRLVQESKDKLKNVLREGIDVVTFTSSSTVDNFVKLAGSNYKALLKGVKIASIGPVTSQTIRKFGLKITKQARVYTIDGLVDAVLNVIRV